MTPLILILFIAVSTALPSDWPANVNYYEGYKVLEVTPNSRQQLNKLQNFLQTQHQIDVWLETKAVGYPAHIMVHDYELHEIAKSLEEFGVQVRIHINDLSRQIKDFVAAEVERRKDNRKVFDLNQFNTLADIQDWLQNTLLPQCEANPGLTCQLTPADYLSVENRTIWVFKMSAGVGKKAILIDAMIHAREWIAGATVFKMMDRLVNQYGMDAEATELLDLYDFVFIPVINVDGYEYTWTNERLWRKNRRQNENCFGVDLNRNFGWNWCIQGANNIQCSDLYCGPGAVSEPESKAVDAVMGQLGGSNIGAYVSYHSYAYMFLTPWGNTEDFTDNTPCVRTNNHDEIYRVAEIAANAIMATYNTTWTYGNGCEIIYPTTGSSDDHAMGIHSIYYPFVPELRGVSFIIAPSEIEPSYQENWNGLVAMTRSLLYEPGPP